MQDVRRMGLHGDLPDMSGGSRCQPMNSSVITRSAKAMHASRNGSASQSLMTLSVHSAIHLCIRSIVQSVSAFVVLASIAQTIDSDGDHIPHNEIVGDATHEPI
jgi:hypothetical protein